MSQRNGLRYTSTKITATTIAVAINNVVSMAPKTLMRSVRKPPGPVTLTFRFGSTSAAVSANGFGDANQDQAAGFQVVT
jgi:hypothetical protein